MALQSLLYVSKSRIEPVDAESEVRQIVATAQVWNRSVGVTGALLFTGEHFAQVIEGDETAISQLIASITRDHRHTQVNVVARDPLVARRFPDWSMAYNGPSQFVSGHVSRLLGDPSPSESPRAAYWLAELLEQFSGFRGDLS